MQHIEMRRESVDRHRSHLMSKGLAAFIEGAPRIPDTWQNDGSGTESSHALAIDETQESQSEHDVEMGKEDSGPDKNSNDINRSSKHHRQNFREDSDLSMVFARATNVLRESLDVDCTVFFDPNSESSTKNNTRTDARESKRMNKVDENSCDAEVLAFSTGEASTASAGSAKASIELFTPLSSSSLKHLATRYGRGNIWSFDEQGNLISSEGSPFELSSGSSDGSPAQAGPPVKQKDSHIRRHETEGQMLKRSFPKARQILYAPLYDSSTQDSLASCFAISMREVPVFTVSHAMHLNANFHTYIHESNIEVAFVRAFVNSVATECSRVNALIAVQKKSDFISSISHVSTAHISPMAIVLIKFVAALGAALPFTWGFGLSRTFVRLIAQQLPNQSVSHDRKLWSNSIGHHISST